MSMFGGYFDRSLSQDAVTVSSCFERFHLAFSRLKEEMKPTPEALQLQGKNDLEGETVAWSALLLLGDRLQERDWNVLQREGQNAALSSLCTALYYQTGGEEADSTSIRLVLNDYLEGGTEQRRAAEFVREHIGDLEAVADELESYKAADLTDAHMIVYRRLSLEESTLPLPSE